MDVRADPFWSYDTSHVGDVAVLLEQLRRSALEAVK
jgi:hypothetical protein